MKEFFAGLFAYNLNFNQMLISSVVSDPTRFPEKSVTLLNHIINAHSIWNNRILGHATIGAWDISPPDYLRKFDQANYESTQQILQSVDLETEIEYANSRGEVFRNSVKDILFHVINHSTYHRGQIASNCKEHGIVPISSDYIIYKR